MRPLTAALVAIGLAGAAFAQHQHLEQRSIKGLSNEQMADLRAGRGMRLALAAELNGYPGPAHVLELADKLDLTTDQHAKVQALFDAMKAETVPLGSKLIDQEAALDNQFATHTVTPDSLKAATPEVATTQGMLRETHLKYHRDDCYPLRRSDASLFRITRLRRSTEDASTQLKLPKFHGLFRLRRRLLALASVARGFNVSAFL